MTLVVYKRYLCAVTQNCEWHSKVAIIFPIIGKKNNQSLVSDADREIPTLRSTDNAGNSVNLRLRHYPSTLGLEFLGLHRRPVTDSTVKILCIGTDRSHQTVQTKIRLLLKKQSDQGLRCLPFNQHLLDALMQCYS